MARGASAALRGRRRRTFATAPRRRAVAVLSRSRRGGRSAARAAWRAARARRCARSPSRRSRRGVRDEVLIVELAAALGEVVARLRELLAEPVALARDVDEARERHEDAHRAEQRRCGAFHRLARGHEVDPLEARELLQMSRVPRDALAIERRSHPPAARAAPSSGAGSSRRGFGGCRPTNVLSHSISPSAAASCAKSPASGMRSSISVALVVAGRAGRARARAPR